MVPDPTTSDAPAPSRLFTILGWACMLLSLYSLVIMAINHVQTSAVHRSQGRPMLLRHLSYGGWELLSILSGIGGVGLWKRRPWAPNFVSAFGGANVGQGGFWLVSGGPLLMSLVRSEFRSAPKVAADAGFFLFWLTLEFVVWLVVLGALFREQGRRQFPPGRLPFTTFGFCILAGAGMAASILMNSYFHSWEKT